MQTDAADRIILGGRYRLDSKVGTGGMSVVYRAMDLQEERIVAVKMLREEYAEDEEFLRHFRNEINAAKDLHHPNIVEIYDFSQEDDLPYIVMEYVSGITLKAYINVIQSMGWRDALNIAAQILSAIDCAHSHGIIHRDIKPQNILITDEGRVKLTDFGIAHAVTEGTRKAGGDSAGSVHYLSPEQARGGFTDERSDIYSIGITLYEMVTGVVPFDGESHVSIALKHIDGNIVPPHTVDPDIPYGVSDLVMMATKKDPAERFQTARDMYARLKMVSANPGYSFLTPENNLDDGAADIQNLEATEFSAPLIIRREDIGEYGTDAGNASDDSRRRRAADYTDRELEINRAEIVRNVTMTTFAYVLAIILGIVGIIFMVNRFNNLNQNMDRFTSVSYRVGDYSAMNAQEVISELTLKGINVVQEPVLSEDYPMGYVVGQSIAAGETITAKDILTLKVSSLSNSFVIDDWTDKDFREAGAALSSAGLIVNYQTVSSAQHKANTVVRTVPAAGQIVAPGDNVTIFYSTGQMSEKVRVPNLIGLSAQEAEMQLNLAGLSLRRAYPDPGSDITDLVATPTPTPEPTPDPRLLPTLTAEPTETATPELTEAPSEDPAGSTEPVITATPVVTETPIPTVPPTATPSPSPVLASMTVVAQYPSAGTEVYVGESVEIYFYTVRMLQTDKELTLEYPSDVQMIGDVNVRIESKPVVGSGSFSDVVFSGIVKREEFPLKYHLNVQVNGMPVKVTVYINGSVYRQILVTADYTEKK
ncbi:MAG: Stk1 family PASTA domain-containing Ser/Thr kinase [Clostridia bacterium]|nr:Stk1 family PASTA domain-containing Ser/Thr kinase [Clostridia bacterium]